MKANHNLNAVLYPRKEVVINTSKIQNESKSQLYCLLIMKKNCCYQYIKDTK